MIINSGHDERGKYSGGKPGDQTGQEYTVISWYSRPWSVMLRYPDINVGKDIADTATKAAKNNHIGYNQLNRTSYWTNLAKTTNYDPSEITTDCDADCSAGVVANVKATGYHLGIKALQNVSKDAYTGNLQKVLEAAGFVAYKDSKYLTSDNYLLPGDILLLPNHHTAINQSYGKYTHSTAQSTEYPKWVKAGALWVLRDSATTNHHGWWKDPVTGYYYFLNKSTGYMEYGKIITDAGKGYMLSGSGAMYASTWCQLPNNKTDWYYAKSDGRLATGWLEYKDNWYYMYGSGKDIYKMATKYLLSYKNDTYYLGKDGIMVKDKFVLHDASKNEYMYFDKEGKWNKKYVVDTVPTSKITE